ncbi:hypothetical protein H4R20_000410 [Coemansia guatemalensis]|uniref:Uncharacterized protein n=1 Tax=Coemansia guatemalensis TaxID=2761395 RepID=A0A9W8LWM6_9FUNG|nr:hypothetical protein H4R20_000410 [Coemansia guatemalensis]
MHRRLGNIRLVTFDLYDTIYTPCEPVEKTYAEPLLRQGIHVDKQKLQKGISHVMKHMRQHYPNYGYGLMSSREWWRQVVDLTWGSIGVSKTTLGHRRMLTAREELIDRFNTSKGYRMFDEVPKVLKYLQQRGITCGVISNMDEAGEKVLCDFGIRSYFDFVLKSVTVGIEKPDSRIFDMALSGVGIPAYDALHVGDSEEMDYHPARRAGMEARIVYRHHDAKVLVARRPEKYIATLEALTDIV